MHYGLYGNAPVLPQKLGVPEDDVENVRYLRAAYTLPELLEQFMAVGDEYLALLLAAEFGSNGTKQSYVKQMAKVVAARRRTESTGAFPDNP